MGELSAMQQKFQKKIPTQKDKTKNYEKNNNNKKKNRKTGRDRRGWVEGLKTRKGSREKKKKLDGHHIWLA